MILVTPISTGEDEYTTPAFPVPHERDLNNYILLFPADAGMEPIDVYLAEGRKGLPQDGHNYHHVAKTEEIIGVAGLIRARKKHLSKVKVVFASDGSTQNAGKFMSGTHNMVNLRFIEPVMVSILVQ